MKGFKNTTRTKYETGGQVVAPAKPVSSPQQIVDKVNAVAGAVKRPTPTPPAPTQGGTVRRPTPMPLAPTQGTGPLKRPTPMPLAPTQGTAPSQSGASQAQKSKMRQSVAGKGIKATVNADTRTAKGGSAKKGVPAHSSKPMIGRKSGGLAVMPKGKC